MILRILYAVRPTNCSRRSLQRPIEVPVAPLVDPIDLRRVPLQGSVEVCGAALEGPQKVGLADDGVGVVVYRPGVVVYRPRVVHSDHLTKRVLRADFGTKSYIKSFKSKKREIEIYLHWLQGFLLRMVKFLL